MWCLITRIVIGKVEKIWKDSLDWIPSPSPSVKIQIIGGKFCLRCKGKTLLGVVNKLLKTKSLLTSLSSQVNFPANNLKFHWRWRWWDLIQAIFLNLSYFALKMNSKIFTKKYEKTQNNLLQPIFTLTPIHFILILLSTHFLTFNIL